MSLECVVSVLKRQALTAKGLNQPKQTFDMTSKLFRKQTLRGVVENGDLKIYAKSSKNISEGNTFLVKFQAKISYILFIYSFYLKPKII